MLFCCYHFVFTQNILSYFPSILHCDTATKLWWKITLWKKDRNVFLACSDFNALGIRFFSYVQMYWECYFALKAQTHWSKERNQVMMTNHTRIKRTYKILTRWGHQGTEKWNVSYTQPFLAGYFLWWKCILLTKDSYSCSCICLN